MPDEREKVNLEDQERGSSFEQRQTPSRKHPTDEGSSPYRPIGEPDVEDVPIEEEPHSAVTPDPYSGVSWEEMRKGMAPQDSTGPDDALYDDRLTSQRYAVDNPEASWDSSEKENDSGEPAGRIPDDLTKPY